MFIICISSSNIHKYLPYKKKSSIYTNSLLPKHLSPSLKNKKHNYLLWNYKNSKNLPFSNCLKDLQYLIFYLKKEISLKQICDSISSNENQTIDLLIEMSIASTIDIKINQKLSIVEIHYAEIPGRQFTHQDTVSL